jgi:hypothetical protein
MFGTAPISGTPPPASTAPFMAVYAGPEDPENYIGSIRLNCDGRIEAFDTGEVLLGVFTDEDDAADAILSSSV